LIFLSFDLKKALLGSLDRALLESLDIVIILQVGPDSFLNYAAIWAIAAKKWLWGILALSIISKNLLFFSPIFSWEAG
jgi:hypothetical protein